MRKPKTSKIHRAVTMHNLHDVVEAGVFTSGRVGVLRLDVKDKSVAITPSALRYVKHHTARSMQRYAVRDRKSRDLISAALIASGISDSIRDGLQIVRVDNIRKGWNNELSVCPGNTPPYLCAVASIAAREQQIQGAEGLTWDIMRDMYFESEA